MIPASSPRSASTSFLGPILAAVGLSLAVLAWMLPVNLRSVSPALLRAAGEGTPSLGAYGRDLVDVEKIGPAALVLAAAKLVNDPRAPALADALEKFGERQPGLVGWGGWDPFLDPLFNLRADRGGARGSTPVLTFFLPEKARTGLRTYLEKSGSEGVQSLLRLRELTKTGRFVPAMRPGGQPLESLLLLTALLYQGGQVSPTLQRELRSLAEAAISKRELADLEPVLVDLLSLGRRLDWTQLAELLRRSDSTKTVGEYAHLARVVPDQLPLIYAAALFSDSADRVAGYLIEYGKAGLGDLKLALGFGAGAVKQLMALGVPVNHSANPALSSAAEAALSHPQLMIALKYAGIFAGLWLLLFGLDRWLVGPGGLPSLAAGTGHLKSGLLSVLFAALLIIATEPFLLKAAPLSEFRLRLPVLVSVANSPLSPTVQKTHTTMDASTLLSIGFFAALQVAMYFACLLKIREIARQNLPPLVKLRLMENEENLFDGGLYIGIGGTATALVLQVLGVIEPNLLAAYSSNLFGITCVALVKIRHVRPFKRELILEGQGAIGSARDSGEFSAATKRS